MNSSLVITAGEIAVSTITSSIVANAVNTDALVTALITFGVSLVTIVGGELIKFLVAYFQKKTKELQEDDDNSKEKEE